MRTIRTRIIAITVSSILISILLFGGIGILFGKMESDQSSVEKLDLICENQQKPLNAYLNDTDQYDVLGATSHSDTIGLELPSGKLVAIRLDNGEKLWEQTLASGEGRTEIDRVREATLAIANLGFFEYADGVDPDGVYRGF